VELHLYDPFLGQHLLGRTYVTKEKEISVVANHFADEIMKELTGEPGVFSTKIAYTQVVKKGRKEIGVMDMNGMNAGTVTKDGTINLSPAWSPGGQIAYSTLDKGGDWQIALVGGKRVTSRGLNISPAWTPSGALTVASILEGDTEIYLMNMSGNVTQQLTHSFGIDVNPAWSPDGSAFVFASERAGRLHIFKADAGGRSVERLTFVGTQNDNPAWSPKGDKIVFQSLSGGWNLFIMNTDGSMLQRLTSEGCESPTWAPNGRFLAASCGGRVIVMREDGSNQTDVGPGGSLQPAWGPWGK
jgi:TolB protein